MALPREIERQIKESYVAEKGTVGTIAARLHVHHSAVRRVLAQAGLPWARVLSPSQIELPLALHPADADELPGAECQPPVCARP